MSFLSMEHGRVAYRADLILYGAAVLLLGGHLLLMAARAHPFELVLLVLLGLICWTLLEYLLHRFVLHGLWPFSLWHAAHHRRPRALICAPTWLSASLICLFVFLPALVLLGAWRAQALTLGVLAGYFGYTLIHHATHHWRLGRFAWARQRKRWHAWHHGRSGPVCYGVSSGLWDHVFGTSPPAEAE